ncbi:coiled-coil-helix-coiled-coil-helix domain-containing protein 10, mitochondrial [Amyelois transitella]|uniref:coiled-coil-helix-coiled-coil-helix domain-containing protein 10, mitochondrial n=1 Tax=Amyelois transitella TaxID=680683 RepID=UPI00067B7CBD|nr:coiled-coil-helix-coiled-coil-helix domain-containing protein 10, mitochondrial [Amyelois transitella]
MSRSRSRSSGGYSRREARSPAHSPPIIVTPMPRRSIFRDAAAVAGGVTVGTAAGHVAGEAITSLFSGRRREEVVRHLPQDYQLGTEPTGPCAFEISTFLQCAANRDNLQECEQFNEALKECKRRNRIP